MFYTSLKTPCIKHILETSVNYVFIVSLDENSLTTTWIDENPSYRPSPYSFIEVVKRKQQPGRTSYLKNIVVIPQR